jgi:serine/threonine protein kinase
MSNLPNYTDRGYEVTGELVGANKHGGRVAYLGTEIATQIPVAIKEFQFAKNANGWSDYSAIEREAKILKQLQYPNIPRYLNSFESIQGYCLVQEYIDARSLAQLMVEKRLFTPDEVKEIITQILEVLVYLQTKFIEPVIHRDLKPSNILIDDNHRPYIIDFGGAKVGEGTQSTMAGTLGFMAPEQFFGKPASTGSDLYGLGMTIVAWLTQTEPGSIYNLLDEDGKIQGLRNLLSTYSLRFVDWLEKMVEPKAKDRYQTAKDALAAFMPLYVRRVPEIQIDRLALYFQSTQLGEVLRQEIIIENNTPETILTGSWQVDYHPSDRLDAQDPHPWIAYSSYQNGNQTICQVEIDTKRLKAGKKYQRSITFQTNAVREFYHFPIDVETAPLPIEAFYPNYSTLLVIAILFWAVSYLLIFTFTNFESTILGLVNLLFSIFKIGISLFIIGLGFACFSSEGGFGVVILNCTLWAIFILPFWGCNAELLPLLLSVPLDTYYLLVAMVLIALIIIIVNREFIVKSYPALTNAKIDVYHLVLVTVFGISLGGINQNVLPSLLTIVSEISIAISIGLSIYAPIKHQNLIVKYRDNERHLIDP